MSENIIKPKSEATSKSRPFTCVVASSKMQKSRVGVIERLVKHPQYGKFIKRRSKIMFHDEQNISQEGDEVLVVQTRPLSARKKFQLLKVVRKRRE